MTERHDLRGAEFVTVGTVGPPGQRVFFLQARAGDLRLTVKMEKTQVIALGQALGELLSDLPTPDPDTVPDDVELEEPVEPQFVAGNMGLTGVDDSDGRAILVIEEITRDPDVPAAEVAHVGMTLGQMHALARRSEELAYAGRPPCPECGLPLDDDHSCPKTNGHLKR